MNTLKVAGSLSLLVACSGQGRPPNADEIPAFVDVQGNATTVGFSNGHLRGKATVPSMAITTEPITVHQYKQCVAAGSCLPPTLATSTCASPATGFVRTLRSKTYGGDDNLPMTCVTVDQAKAYCQWQGANLPTLPEWLLAARGAAVATYPWGETVPTCDKHPNAVDENGALCAQSVADFNTAGHPNGAGPSGMQDALLTPGELVRTSSDALFGPCVNGGPAGACVVSGFGAGGIDRVAAAPTDVAKGASPAAVPTFGFRCVKEGAQ